MKKPETVKMAAVELLIKAAVSLGVTQEKQTGCVYSNTEQTLISHRVAFDCTMIPIYINTNQLCSFMISRLFIRIFVFANLM